MTTKQAAAIVAKVQKEAKAGMLSERDYVRSPTAAEALALKGDDRLALAMAFFDAYAEFADQLRDRRVHGANGKWMNLHERRLWLSMGTRLLQKQEQLGVAEWERVFASMSKYELLSTFDHPLLATFVSIAEKHLSRLKPMPRSLRKNMKTFARSIAADGRAAELRLAKRLEDLLVDENETGGPGVMETFLLDRERLRVESSEPLWRRLLAALSLPAEGDDETPVRFDGVGLEKHKAAVAWLNGVFADAPNDTRSEHAARVARAANKRCGEDLSLSFVQSALAAVSHKQLRYVYESRRFGRFNAALEGLLEASFACLNGNGIKDGADLVELCLAVSATRGFEWYRLPIAEAATRVAEAAVKAVDKAAPPRLVCALLMFRERVARAPEGVASLAAFDRALHIGVGFPVDLGERWSDAIRRDTLAMPAAERARWVAFLDHCAAAKGSKPAAKWLSAAKGHVEAVGAREVEARFAAWLGLVGKARPAFPLGTVSGRDSSVPGERGADMLRGMAWAASHIDTARMASTLGDLAMACYKMVPGVGARCIKPGTSAVWSLSGMSTPAALGQLSRVRQLVKFGTAQKTLDAALEGLASKLGITTEELHEIAAPDFGLERDGRLREEAGEFVLELRVGPDGAEIVPIDASGKARKSIPDGVKKEYGDLLKGLKQTQGDIDKMLDAQRARVDALFVMDRAWKVEDWRQRYIDHPLVGVLGRRMIWSIVDDAKAPGRGVAVFWDETAQRFTDLDGAPVDASPGRSARLWHPIFAGRDEVLAWRRRFEERGVRQPVKQAHREVYPLTDAERRTGTYSNRYAAHYLKQHAFQKLAQERGWKSRLRLMVDDEYAPPTRELPAWGLRAEFWIESIAQEYGRDTTETGSLLYIATDQVRFYSSGAAQARAHAGGGRYETRAQETDANRPLPLERVPPLVFSEIMRDVDLFVSGSSVGNNADWSDGGPGGGFGGYWQSYSFGELGPSAVSRQEILKSLAPRLTIGPVCSFQGRFLVVRGKLRTYKIHLGSGNILMEPNDQYLCIVPSSADEVRAGKVYLPFEGDRVMAIILSKAVLLADDDKIKDSTITSQILRT